MRKNLAERQERMRQKATQPPAPVQTSPQFVEKQVQPSRQCSVLGCTRQARRGSSVCSRCSFTKQEAILRDTLPGMPIEKVKELQPELKHLSSPVPLKPETKGDAIADIKETTFSRRQVAEMLQISQTTICRWEKKGNTPLPLRIARTGQLLYTNEIIAAMRLYRDAIDIPAPQTPQTQQEKAAAQTVKKTFNLNRRLERTVSSKLGGAIRNFGGSGRLI